MESPWIQRKKAILTVVMPVLALSIGFLLALGSGLFDSWEDRLQDLATSGSMVKNTGARERLSIPFATLDLGTGGPWRGETAVHAGSEAAWLDAMSERVDRGVLSALPPIPQVDWERQEVVLVAMESRGFTIEITEAAREGEALVIGLSRAENGSETPDSPPSVAHHLVALERRDAVKELRIRKLWESPAPPETP